MIITNNKYVCNSLKECESGNLVPCDISFRASFFDTKEGFSKKSEKITSN